ncbi:YvcK family protein [bacterium]|nr:YvcK family protein [bacterium]
MSHKKIVTIGGGTGSFTILSGLKNYPVLLSAIVSMADDGGSTGVLRDELGVLPPGDVRQCLVALSESSEKLRELMNYRFENGGLRSHNFGNIFLSALEKVNGSFAKGVEEAIEILKVRGRVLPVTEKDAKLKIVLKNEKVLYGEDMIGKSREFQAIGIKELAYDTKVTAYPKALRAIQEADMVVIGPGDIYTSILPNLIIKEVAEAEKRTKAKVVLVANLTNKKGHTTRWDVDDYVHAIEQYIGRGRINYVIYNTKKPLPTLVKKYELQEGRDSIVQFDPKRNPKRVYKLVKTRVASDTAPRLKKGDALAGSRAFIRHDSGKLARTIMFLLEFDVNQKVIQEIL